MGTRGKHLGNNSSLVAGLSQLQRCAHTGAAAADNHAVERNSTNSRHSVLTPEDLDTPDHVDEDDKAAADLEGQAQYVPHAAHHPFGEVVGADRPHTDPGVSRQGENSHKGEDTHASAIEHCPPLSVVDAAQEGGTNAEKVGEKNNAADPLHEPIGQAGAAETCY